MNCVAKVIIIYLQNDAIIIFIFLTKKNRKNHTTCKATEKVGKEVIYISGTLVKHGFLQDLCECAIGYADGKGCEKSFAPLPFVFVPVWFSVSP